MINESKVRWISPAGGYEEQEVISELRTQPFLQKTGESRSYCFKTWDMKNIGLSTTEQVYKRSAREQFLHYLFQIK